MANLSETLGFFRKLLKVLNFEADVTFFGCALVKKSKIDDVLCCILATLPDSYKRIMKQREGKDLKSVVAYDMLYNAIKGKFIFNSNVYLVRVEDAKKYISTILVMLEKDMAYIEESLS